ncbi:hypothetical protein O1L60_42915 [Streptomyces diastatochromogenes]|nr:hypothetical protein [Streptomyces diastatochromogenes]
MITDRSRHTAVLATSAYASYVGGCRQCRGNLAARLPVTRGAPHDPCPVGWCPVGWCPAGTDSPSTWRAPRSPGDVQ